MKSLFLAGAAMLLTGGAACAQPAPPPGQPAASRPDRPRIDADADGKISWAEFQASQTARFTLRDANKDGRIAKDERPARPDGKKRPGGGPSGGKEGGPRGDRRMGPGMGMGMGMGMGRGGPGMMMGGGMMFDRMDQNDDGFVTKAETDAAAKRLFTFLDLNNDGVLSGKELPTRGRGGPGMQGGPGGPRGPGGPDGPPPSGKPD